MLKNIRQIFRDLRITPAAGAMFIQGQLKSVHWRGAPESERHRAATDFKSEIFKFSLNPIKSTPFVESEKKNFETFQSRISLYFQTLLQYDALPFYQSN